MSVTHASPSPTGGRAAVASITAAAPANESDLFGCPGVATYPAAELKLRNETWRLVRASGVSREDAGFRPLSAFWIFQCRDRQAVEAASDALPPIYGCRDPIASLCALRPWVFMRFRRARIRSLLGHGCSGFAAARLAHCQWRAADLFCLSRLARPRVSGQSRVARMATERTTATPYRAPGNCSWRTCRGKWD